MLASNVVHNENIPAAAHVIVQSPPLGVSGSPVTAVGTGSECRAMRKALRIANTFRRGRYCSHDVP